METDRLLGSPEGQAELPEPERSHIKNLLFGNLIVFVLTLSGTMYMPVMEQYLYKRVSEEVFNETYIPTANNACYINTSDPHYALQEKAQSITSGKQIQFTILQSSLGIISNVVLGVYSDFIGRKILFVVPIVGHLIRLILTTVIIYWNLSLNFFFLAEGVDGLMGGFYGIIMAAFVYTADNTPPTGARTIGVAFAEVPFYVASSLTSVATGYFIQDTGFFYPALTASILCLLDLLLVVGFLPKSRYIDRETNSRCISVIKGLKRVFGFYVLDGNALRKACFITAVLSFVFNIGLVMGASVDTLFLLNQPFCWSPEKLGYFQTVSSVIGPIIGLPFTKLMQYFLIDEVIGIIGSGAIIISDVIHSLAKNDVMMYTVVGVGAFGNTISGITRAILSRMVPHHRQGSLFASIAVIEAVCTLVGSPIFNSIYQSTVTIWRGLVYIALASSHVLAVIFLLIYIFVSRRMKEDERCDTPRHVQHTEEEEEDLSA